MIPKKVDSIQSNNPKYTVTKICLLFQLGCVAIRLIKVHYKLITSEIPKDEKILSVATTETADLILLDFSDAFDTVEPEIFKKYFEANNRFPEFRHNGF